MLIVVAFFIAKKYEPEVKEIVISELNKQLAVKVKVDDINLSLIRRFPYAAVRFKNVVVPQVINGAQQPDTLLYIQDFYLQMSVMSLLRKQYEITDSEVNKGFFNMELYSDGSDNFHFWKQSTDTLSTGKTALSITQILVKNFEYRLHTAQGLHLNLGISKARAQGNFGDKQYKISSDTDLSVHTAAYQGDTLYAHEKLKGSLVIAIDRTTDIYSFSSKKLYLVEERIDLSGAYMPTDSQNWDIKLSAARADLKNLIHLLPEQFRNKFSTYNLHGRTDLLLHLNAGKNFDLDAEFSSLSGKFQHYQALGTAEIRRAKGKFEIKNSITSIYLDDLSASIGPGKIDAWGKIIDFDAPSFDLNIEGSFDLEELKSLLNIETLKTLEGEVMLNGRLQGKLPRESSNSTLALLKGIDFIGKINLSDGVFQMQNQDQRFDRINGDIQLKDNAVIVEWGKARVNESPFEISGIIKNALPYISRDGEKLSIKADFRADVLNFNDILTQNQSQRDTTYNFRLPADVAFDFSVEVGQIKFRKFEATNILGNAYYKSGLLTLNPVTFQTSKGDVHANIHLEQIGEKKFEAQSTASLYNIDLTHFFMSFENFGQQVIQSRHLKGRANATIQFSAIFNNDLSIDSKSIKSDVNLVVLNGELRNLESLQSIADYLRSNALWRSLIKVKEFEKKLKIIHFDTLQNTISIADENIVIPAMTIGSSALTLNISGNHRFDNNIDYSLNFRLSDLLRTGKKETNDFGYIVDDQTGLRLFMKMKGNVDNPEFSLDGSAAREKRKQQFDREKNVFKSILKEEFGLFKSDTTLRGIPEKPKGETRFSIDLDDFKNVNDTSPIRQKSKTKKKSTRKDDDFYDNMDDDL